MKPLTKMGPQGRIPRAFRSTHFFQVISYFQNASLVHKTALEQELKISARNLGFALIVGPILLIFMSRVQPGLSNVIKLKGLPKKAYCLVSLFLHQFGIIRIHMVHQVKIIRSMFSYYLKIVDPPSRLRLVSGDALLSEQPRRVSPACSTQRVLTDLRGNKLSQGDL